MSAAFLILPTTEDNMYYFIVNPVSRSGKGLKIWEYAEEILKERKIEYESFILDHQGEARELAHFLSLNKTPCTIVVVGGDGTINEFISGLATYEGITFGYIPTGSGNDFARGMRLPKDPRDSLDMILEPQKLRNINIGVTTSGDTKKYFAVSSGIGYDAAVCHMANASDLKKILNKIHLGKLVYLMTALRMLISMKPAPMRILLDDNQLLTFRKVYFTAAMNTKFEGGGFMFCPKASPVDNYLDLIVADGFTKPKALLVLLSALQGRHVKKEGIHIFRCKRAVIQTEEDTCVHIDGETFGFCKKVSFDLMKEKLTLIVD